MQPPKLFPYQQEGIQKMLSFLSAREASCYNASEVGLGKTCMAIITTINLAAKNILIICPKSVISVWDQELVKWGYTQEATILNYEACRKESTLQGLLKNKWDVLILDEAHRVKNYKAQQTKAVLGSLWDKCRYKIALSATPFTSSVADGFTLFNKMAPDIFPNYFKFTEEYTNIKEVWIGGRMRGHKYEGVKNAEKLKNLIRSKFYLRYQKSEVEFQMPEKIWQRLELDKKFLNLEQSEESTRINPNREQGLLKVKPISEFASELLEGELPILIFAWHKDVVEKYREALKKYNPYVITGETSANNRKRLIEDFQKGKTNCFILNYEAGGLGITLTRAAHALLAEIPFNPSTITQAVGRIDRVTQAAKHLHIYYWVVKDSYDERKEKLVVDKALAFNEVIKNEHENESDSES